MLPLTSETLGLCDARRARVAQTLACAPRSRGVPAALVRHGRGHARARLRPSIASPTGSTLRRPAGSAPACSCCATSTASAGGCTGTRSPPSTACSPRAAQRPRGMSATPRSWRCTRWAPARPSRPSSRSRRSTRIAPPHAPKRSLIVCPLSVLRVWEDTLRAWTTLGETLLVADKQADLTAEALASASVVVTTPDVLQSAFKSTWMLDPTSKARRKMDRYHRVAGAPVHPLFALCATPNAFCLAVVDELHKYCKDSTIAGRAIRIAVQGCHLQAGPHGHARDGAAAAARPPGPGAQRGAQVAAVVGRLCGQARAGRARHDGRGQHRSQELRGLPRGARRPRRPGRAGPAAQAARHHRV